MLLRRDPLEPGENDLRASDAVFSGEALAVGQSAAGIAGGTASNVPVEFVVERPFKGVDGQEVSVPGGDGVSCGFAFQEGARYLVYAERSGGEKGALGVDLCGPTKLLAAAGQDLAVLDPPTHASPNPGRLAPTGGPPIFPAIVLLAVPSLVVATLLCSRGRTRA